MECRALERGEIVVLKPGKYEISSSRSVWISGERDTVSEANCMCTVQSRTPLLVAGTKEESLEISFKELSGNRFS